MNDLTVIYITAGKLREGFAKHLRDVLWKAKGKAHLISVSKQPLDFGENISFPQNPTSIYYEYKETFEGVKLAKTKYIAIAEDDTLYSADHFKLRPIVEGVFHYNINCWNIYTWNPSVYSYNGRMNHNTLICERDLYIKAMTERFEKYPTPDSGRTDMLCEPGRYEEAAGLTVYPTQALMSHPPNV